MEVGQDAKSCSRCGRFFASVRCPVCGFTGKENTFTRGCPSCGYSAPPPDAADKTEKKVPAGSLPLWVYIISIIAFIGVVAILIYRMAH